MVSIELSPEQQSRLDEIARIQGQDREKLAKRVLLDYLDFHALPTDLDEAWAEASVALAPECLGPEEWDETGHGS